MISRSGACQGVPQRSAWCDVTSGVSDPPSALERHVTLPRNGPDSLVATAKLYYFFSVRH